MKVVAKRKIKYPIALERTWAKEIVSHVAALMNVVKSYAPRMGRTLLSMAAVFDADDGELEDELSATMDEMGEEVDSLPSMRPQAEKMYDRVDRHAYMELAAVFDVVFGTRPMSLSREPFPPVYGASAPQGAGSAFQSARESGGFAKMMTNEAQLDQLKRIWVQENLDLIKSIDAETLRKIRETMADMILGTVDRAELTRDLQRGLVPAIFKKPLEEITRRERNRAALIGRDQVGKLNGRLTEYYQRQAGIEEYEWSTAGDERVRPSHRALAGKIFKWNSPPPEGHPGQPIQCRCIADPIIDIDKIGMVPKKGSFTEAGEDGIIPLESGGSPVPNSIHHEYAVVSDNGLRNSYTVDFALVNSKAYHDKFDGLTGHKAVDEALYKKATEFLSHRGGTPYEDIAMMDSRTGAVLAENMSASGNNTFQSWITENDVRRLNVMGKRFEILHNHPGNTLPSVNDIEWLFRRPLADASTVIAHDGTIYRLVKLKPYDDMENWLKQAVSVVKRENAGMPDDFVERKASRMIIAQLTKAGYLEYMER